MVESTGSPEVAIGGCRNCRQLFLITPDSQNCLLCGQAPTYVLPFPLGRAIAEAHGLEIHEAPLPPTDEEGIMPPPSTAPEELPEEEDVEPLPTDTIGRELILLEVISTFLDGGDIDQHYLSICFQDVGVDPETAATAVGRLQAVRDLIRDVRDQGRKASVTVTGPPPAGEEPEEGLPPPLTSEAAEEGDRTTVPSP